jgi:metal-responsive CopG/Arc/MetJ family transcriptional regulator
MKTAISIPDDLFAQAERLVRRAGTTRSHLYSSAVREYVARHASDEVTAAMDRVCDAVGDARDPFADAAAKCTMERAEW